MRLGVTESRLRARTSTATRHETNVHAKGRVRCGTRDAREFRRATSCKHEVFHFSICFLGEDVRRTRAFGSERPRAVDHSSSSCRARARATHRTALNRRGRSHRPPLPPPPRLGLGRGAAAATAAAAAATTATGGDGGELSRAFLDQLSDILAVNGGEESRELGIVDLRGDCVFWERKRRERQRGVHGFARLATVRTRAAGGGSDVRGDARRWITRRHAPEARTALTSASEGESLPPSCACCRRERWSGKRVSGKP